MSEQIAKPPHFLFYISVDVCQLVPFTFSTSSPIGGGTRTAVDKNASWHKFQHLRLVFSSPLWHSTPRVSRGIEIGHEANQMNNWLLWWQK